MAGLWCFFDGKGRLNNMAILTDRTDKRRYETWKKEKWDNEFQEYCSKMDEKTIIEVKNEQYTGEFESMPLMQLICEKIFKIFYPNIQFFIREGYSSCINEQKDFLIYYDVMNTKNKCIEYHTIGNFVWYPQMEKCTLQKIHKWFNEDWGKFLSWLRENWSKKDIIYQSKNTTNIFQQSKSFEEAWGMTFKKYMILTLQQVYYKEVFDKIVDSDLENWEDCFNTIIKMSLHIKAEGEFVDTEKKENIEKLIKIREKMVLSVINPNFAQNSALKAVYAEMFRNDVKIER